MAAQIIDLFTPEGTKPYERFSSRLPRFQEKYPIAEGWRYVHEVAEAASLTPLLASLHASAIAAGKMPSDLGLEPLPKGLIYTSRLFNPAGEEVSSGSASSPSLDLFNPRMGLNSFGETTVFPRKDFESAATAAYQRLLASVGFGGEVFNPDEERTLEAMGVKSQPTSGSVVEEVIRSSPAASVSSAVGAEGTTMSGGPLDVPMPMEPGQAFASVWVADDGDSSCQPLATAASVSAGSENVTPSCNPVVTGVAASTFPGKPANGGRGPNQKQLLAGLKRQIDVLARQVKSAARTVSTPQEAEAEINRLADLLLR